MFTRSLCTQKWGGHAFTLHRALRPRQQRRHRSSRRSDTPAVPLSSPASNPSNDSPAATVSLCAGGSSSSTACGSALPSLSTRRASRYGEIEECVGSGVDRRGGPAITAATAVATGRSLPHDEPDDNDGEHDDDPDQDNDGVVATTAVIAAASGRGGDPADGRTGRGGPTRGDCDGCRVDALNKGVGRGDVNLGEHHLADDRAARHRERYDHIDRELTQPDPDLRRDVQPPLLSQQVAVPSIWQRRNHHHRLHGQRPPLAQYRTRPRLHQHLLRQCRTLPRLRQRHLLEHCRRLHHHCPRG